MKKEMSAEIFNEAKLFWMKYLPLNEMPSYAKLVISKYRKGKIGEVGVSAALNQIEKDIMEWFETNIRLEEELNLDEE